MIYITYPYPLIQTKAMQGWKYCPSFTAERVKTGFESKCRWLQNTSIFTVLTHLL